MATHDLGNAMQIAQGAHDLLRLYVTDPDGRDAVESLGEALRRMTYLVNTLRNDTSSSRPAGQSSAADLGYVLAALLRGHPGVVIDVPAGLRTACAPQDLERIFINLVSNAEAYGAPPIEIRGRRRGGFIEFTVTDHGNGIRPDVVSSLFEPYTRGPEHARKFGSGLGLAIVRDLCDANEGWVRYQPRRHRGAQFKIALPPA
jgi:signal transduction histidine kinase